MASSFIRASGCYFDLHHRNDITCLHNILICCVVSCELTAKIPFWLSRWQCSSTIQFWFDEHINPIFSQIWSIASITETFLKWFWEALMSVCGTHSLSVVSSVCRGDSSSSGELPAEAPPCCCYSPLRASGFLRCSVLPECPVCPEQQLHPLPPAEQPQGCFMEFGGWEDRGPAHWGGHCLWMDCW